MQRDEKDFDPHLIAAFTHLVSILLWPVFFGIDIRFWIGRKIVMQQIRREQRSAQIFFHRYKAWAHETFGATDPQQGFTKMAGELEEARNNPSDMVEYADLLMCLMYSYSCQFPDKTFDELIEVANEKLCINMKRKWKLQPDGTYQHIKCFHPV
jgi:hypothetical protein